MRFQFVTTNGVQRAPRTPRVPKTSIPTIQAASSSNPISARLAEDIIIDDNCWVGAFLNTCAKSCNTGDNFSKDTILGFDEEGKTFFQTLQESCPEDATKYINQCVDLIQKSASLQEAFGIVVMTKMKSFSKEERQGKGKVYTPQEIVDWIHNKLIEQEPLCPADGNWTPGRRGLDKTYCDFACGTGHFVLDWYDRLMRHWEENQSHYQDIAQTKSEAHKWIVENCLYFADIDPFAIRICKMGLFLKDYSVVGVRFNSFCGDSLLDEPFGDRKFNYVAGNPPYGRARFSDCKYKQEAYKQRWSKSQSGEFNYYKAFIELGLERGQILGYVTPATWLSSPQGDKIRKLFLKRNIVGICSYAEGLGLFENVEQAVTTFVISRGAQQEKVSLQRMVKRRTKVLKGEVYHKSLSSFYDRKRDLFFIALSETEHNLTKKLLDQPKVVADLGKFKTGEVNIGTNKELLTQERNVVPYCTGEMLHQRYVVDVTKAKWFWNPNLPITHPKAKGVQVPKIIIKQIGGKGAGNFCDYWLKGSIYNDSLVPSANYTNYSVVLNKVCAYSLLGLLNSRVLNYIYSTINDSNGTSPSSVNYMPIPESVCKIQNMTEEDISQSACGGLYSLIKKMLVNPEDEKTEKELNQTICALYGLSEDEIKVVEDALKA